MPHIDTYRKRAKQLMRWHRDRNHSLGGLVRQLPRFRQITDADALAMPFPLALAQEVVAVDAGFSDWMTLKAATSDAEKAPHAAPRAPVVRRVTPIFHVLDVAAAADYYVEKLGFVRDFLHGNPPFYGAVSRDGVALHLRLVHRPNFSELAATEHLLILASFVVENVQALFEEVRDRGAIIAQPLAKQPWGGTDFYVRDPDGNAMSFVTYSG